MGGWGVVGGTNLCEGPEITANRRPSSVITSQIRRVSLLSEEEMS